MKKQLISIIGVATMMSATLGTAQAATTQTQTVSARTAYKALWVLENKLPVWPKNLAGFDANTNGTYWVENKSLPETEWFGFQASDPDVTTAQWDQIADAIPTTPVTAGQIAQWIVQWEESARRVDLKIEPTSDPFKLLQIFSVFYGTGITSPSTVVSSSQLFTIFSNLNDVTNGYRQLAHNKIQLLSPLIDAVNMNTPLQQVINAKVKVDGQALSWTDWPKVYGQIVALEDSTTLAFEKNGDLIYDSPASKTYSLGADIAFATPGGKVTSDYWYAGGTNLGKDVAFDEHFPAVYSPKQHPVNYQGHWTFTKTPVTNHIAIVKLMPFNAWSWQQHTWCAYGQQISVTYDKNGNFEGFTLVGVESENYPAEVIAYGS